MNAYCVIYNTTFCLLFSVKSLAHVERCECIFIWMISFRISPQDWIIFLSCTRISNRFTGINLFPCSYLYMVWSRQHSHFEFAIFIGRTKDNSWYKVEEQKIWPLRIENNLLFMICEMLNWFNNFINLFLNQVNFLEQFLLFMIPLMGNTKEIILWWEIELIKLQSNGFCDFIIQVYYKNYIVRASLTLNAF